MMTDTAADTERWTLVKDFVDSISIYPDRLTVQVAGAPPFIVALDEVGLTQGCKPVVSESRLPQSEWRITSWSREGPPILGVR